MQLLQQAIAVVEGARIGCIDERKVLRLPQSISGEPQQQCREVGAQYLGLREGRALLKILLAVQAHAQSGGEPAAAAFALIRAGAGHRFDGQALQPIAHAVAADTRQPGVNDGTDARYRNRCLGHVGRQHNPLSRAALKDLALLLPGQARIQAQHFDARSQFALEQFADVANLALARQKHQDVAVADLAGFGCDLLIGLEHRQRQIGVFIALFGLPIAHFDGIATAADGDDRRIVKEARYPFNIESG